MSVYTCCISFHTMIFHTILFHTSMAKLSSNHKQSVLSLIQKGTNSFREGSFVTTTTTTVTTTITTLSSGGVGGTSPPGSAMAQHLALVAAPHSSSITGGGNGNADGEMYGRRSDPVRPGTLPPPALGDLGTGAYALPGTPPPSAPSLLQVSVARRHYRELLQGVVAG